MAAKRTGDLESELLACQQALAALNDAHLGAQRRVELLEREATSLRRAVALLHRVAKLVRQSLELEPTFYAILTGVTAGQGLSMNRAMLFSTVPDRRGLIGVAAVGPADAAEADSVWRSIVREQADLEELYEAGLKMRATPCALDLRVRDMRVDPDGDTPIALALRRSAVVRGEGSDDLGGLLHLPTSVATPLRGRHRTVGVLYADNCFTGQSLDQGAQLVISLVADHAGRAIENAYTFEGMAERARTDALTGLEHHGSMMEALRRALDGRATLGLAMIDLDDFKHINDTHGHLAGDALLVEVARRLRETLRAEARVYRYGGEEFAAVLPACDEPALSRVGERLREAVEGAYRLRDHYVDVTCSVGVALAGPQRHTPNALIAAADAALLRAKRSGKNCVEMAD